MSYNKKKRYFSSNYTTNKRKNLFIEVGLKGFICTCNGYDKECIRESYNLLNEYADKLLKNQSGESVDSNVDEDVLDEFKKEIQSLQIDNSNKNVRFQAVDTGIINCIFIKTNLEDTVEFMHTIVEHLSCTKQKKTRFLVRMVPVEIICKAYIDDIKKAACPLIDKYFKSEPITYGIIFNRRNNSNVERLKVIEALGAMVQERNDQHKVNLTNPKLSIIVEIMKGFCCLSVIRDYFQFCKYNLHSICEPTIKQSDDNSPEKTTNELFAPTEKESLNNNDNLNMLVEDEELK